jgi:NAD(P)H-hydrate epimerase
MTVVINENFNSVIQNILSQANWIIDAIFGTGLRGIVQPPYDKIIQAINNVNTNVLSIDIPSGLDCDLGEPLGIAVKAMHTVTFTNYKKGFINPQAKKFLGHVQVVDIGVI